MAARALTQTTSSTALAGGETKTTATRADPATPTREGVDELQTLAGNAATRASLPEAKPQTMPSVSEAVLQLELWFYAGDANRHAEEIAQLLMLLRDQRAALDAEFGERAGQTLAEAIRAHLSGVARVRAERIHEQGHLDLADELYFAVKGAGSEKGTLDRLLAEASGDSATVEAQFHERYAQDYGTQGELPDAAKTKSWIAGMLDDELSFAVEASWVALPRAKAIYRYGKLRKIDEVHLAIVGPGTDTPALFAALASFGTDHAGATRLYKESYGEDLKTVLTEPWFGELSFGDRDRALAFFAGGLDLVKSVELMIGTLSTDEQAIFDAIAAAPTAERAKLRAELDKRPLTALGERYHGANSGLDAGDKRRINALLALSGPDAEGKAAPLETRGSDPTAAVVTLLESEGGTSWSTVFKTIKMAPYASWKHYRDAYPVGGSAFQHYVDERTTWDEKVDLLTVLSKDPDSLRKRLLWAMSGLISDDEPYLFHLLAGFTADETGEGPTRRDLATDTALLARMDQKLSKSELARARALMRPKDLSPAETVAWFETDFERADSWIGKASESYDALLDARRELLTTFARAQRDGNVSAAERKEIERLETRARASLDVYSAVRDEFEGCAVQAITTAVGLLLAVPSGGASIAVLAGNMARAAIYSGLTRLMAEKLVRGDRFEFASNEALAAFAGGAAEGVTNVVGASVAKGLTGPLIARLENGGPALAKLAAGQTFKTFAATAEKATEGAFGSVVTTTVESAAKDETWVNGFEGIVSLAGQVPGAAVTGAVMAVGTDLAQNAAKGAVGRVKKVLAADPKPIVDPHVKPGPVGDPHAKPEPVADPHAKPDPLVAAKPTVAPLAPLPPGASLYRRRAHAFIEKFPVLMQKLDRGMDTLDALQELFHRSGGYGATTTPRTGQSVPVQHRAAPSEIKTLLDYAGRADVTRIELLPSSAGAGRTPDMYVTHAGGLQERVEITTVTGTQRGYQPHGAGGSAEATVETIGDAIKRKVAPSGGKASQFTSGAGGRAQGGTLVVHVQRGGPLVEHLLAGRVVDAVNAAASQLAAHPEVRRLEFWLPGARTPMVFTPQGGTFTLVPSP